MNKKIDVQKVDAALKRAARTAVIGSRDARSGRYVEVKPHKRSAAGVYSGRRTPKK